MLYSPVSITLSLASKGRANNDPDGIASLPGLMGAFIGFRVWDLGV